MMSKDRIVCIEWEDSYHESDWMPKSVVRRRVHTSKCKTVGFLLRSNFKEVTVFQSKSDSGNVTDIMSIPRKCIKNMRFLDE